MKSICLNHSEYPETFKETLMCPIYETGDATSMNR